MVEAYMEHRRRKLPAAGRCALALDLDDEQDLEALLKARAGLAAAGEGSLLVFLEAGESTLAERCQVRGGSTTACDGTDIDSTASRDRERALLASLRPLADLVIDSSFTSPTEERDRVLALAEGHLERPATVVDIASFGFKHGTAAGDLVVDLRFIPNPYYVPALRASSGRDPECAAYVFASGHARDALSALTSLVTAMRPAFEAQGRPTVRVRLGCTGGRHRSVAMTEALAAKLIELGISVRVWHRDLRE
jgi:UPF0042 nucleotide-binding protein